MVRFVRVCSWLLRLLMLLCVVCWCRVIFDDVCCVLLLFLVVGVVVCVLLFVGCCVLSGVVLRGPLFVFVCGCFGCCWLLLVVVCCIMLALLCVCCCLVLLVLMVVVVACLRVPCLLLYMCWLMLYGVGVRRCCCAVLWYVRCSALLLGVWRMPDIIVVC